MLVASLIIWKGRHIDAYWPEGSVSSPYCLKQALV
jgi:hypothetical protein